MSNQVEFVDVPNDEYKPREVFVWCGPGWYAPVQEGSHEGQHIRWYQVDGPDGEPGLGTPKKFSAPGDPV